VQWRRKHYNKRVSRFFLIGLSHNSLANMYHTNFSLMQHHKYSLTELENMIPFERDLYVLMLVSHLKELEEKRKQNG
jgi:hypothetical protein